MYGTIDIQRLNREKIIQADVKLEETDMELESLELLNKEMNVKLTSLEKEVKSYTTASLHSIHSEDLICLSKIHQLAKEELCMKHCIKQMEQKETLFREHMDRLLTCKEYQNICDKRKMVSCLQNMNCNGRMLCYEPKKCPWYKSAICHSKKPLSHEARDVFNESEKTQTQNDAIVSTSEHSVSKRDKSQGTMEKKSSWIPNWFSKSQKSQEGIPPSEADESSTISTQKNDKSDKPVTVEASTEPVRPARELKDKKITSDKQAKTSKHTSLCKPCDRDVCPPVAKKGSSRKGKDRICAGKLCTPCNISCLKPRKGDRMMPRKSCFDTPCCLADHGIKKPCKLYMPTCSLKSPCEICPSIMCKDDFPPTNNCRCICTGKCAKGLTEAKCNCSDALDPLELYQPTASQLHNNLYTDDSNSDDFCECCSCGCEDSDESYSCQCN